MLVTQSYLTLCNPTDCMWPTKLLSPWDSPGKNTGVGCHSLLQGIFPTQGLNLCLLHCRQIPYCLSHQEIPVCIEGDANNIWQLIWHRHATSTARESRLHCKHLEHLTGMFQLAIIPVHPHAKLWIISINKYFICQNNLFPFQPVLFMSKWSL